MFQLDFLSGQLRESSQGRTYRQVCGCASRAQGHPQGAPLRGQTGQEIRKGGLIRFRQQLSVSTSGYALILESPVQRLRCGVILLTTSATKHPKADMQSLCRQQQPVYSGFSLVSCVRVHRVEHTNSEDTHKGRSYGTVRFATGQNGPIRFRQQLFLSTSGNGRILEFLA
jgi:hypothetical protein